MKDALEMLRQTAPRNRRIYLIIFAASFALVACTTSSEGETARSTVAVESPDTTETPSQPTSSGAPAGDNSARLVVDGVEIAFEGACSVLENLGRATYFGTGSVDGESLELSVSYQYPDGEFDASGGFTVLTSGGDIYVESNGLNTADFDGEVIQIDAPMQGTSVTGPGEGVLEVSC